MSAPSKSSPWSSSLWVEAGVVAMSFGLPAALLASVDKVRRCASFPVLVAIFGGLGGCLHLVFEATGLNAWYCSKGHACQRRKAQPEDSLKDLAGGVLWFGMLLFVWCASASASLNKFRYEFVALFAAAAVVDFSSAFRIIPEGQLSRVVTPVGIFSMLVIAQALARKCTSNSGLCSAPKI